MNVGYGLEKPDAANLTFTDNSGLKGKMLHHIELVMKSHIIILTKIFTYCTNAITLSVLIRTTCFLEQIRIIYAIKCLKEDGKVVDQNLPLKNANDVKE